MDQLVCASISLTHNLCEAGMLKVSADFTVRSATTLFLRQDHHALAVVTEAASDDLQHSRMCIVYSTNHHVGTPIKKHTPLSRPSLCCSNAIIELNNEKI